MKNPRKFSQEPKQRGPKRHRTVDSTDLRSGAAQLDTNHQTAPRNPVNWVVSPSNPTKSGTVTDAHLTDGFLLPPMVACDEGKHTLVLDMDGTLLGEFNKKGDFDHRGDFVLRQKPTGALTFVSKRPQLERFLAAMEKLFEIVIFTESSKKRADVILDALINSKCIRHRLYRDSCTEIGGRLVKDLCRLGRDLSKVILIDDCPFCYALQPSNAIRIAWFSGDRRDLELPRVYNFIRRRLNLSANVDVRIALRRRKFRNRIEKNINAAWDCIPVGPLLCPMDPSDAGKHTLVLDMDGTLLVELLHQVPNSPPDFISPCRDGVEQPTTYVYKRPGVENFLAAMAELFEIVVFSGSLYWRAMMCLVHFENLGCIRFRLFRNSCITLNGRLFKDLSLLGRDLRRVIIVDDQPALYELQVSNGIPIKPFDGDPSDRELTDLIPFLEELSNQEDVRPLIQSRYDREVEVLHNEND